jgi:outer membrane protein TolC
MRSFVVATLVIAMAGREGSAQDPRLTLAEAFRRAEANSFTNRGARAVADAQGANAVSALRGILPTVRTEAGRVRTTDPIGAFGTNLRQRTITQQDFDPTRLNYPSAITNYLGGLVIEQPLLNADAWAGRRAARQAYDAANASAAWAEVGTRVDVIKAYYGAVLAAEKVATLTVAMQAAREHVRLAESMARNGVVTTSDAMLAGVKAGEVEVQLVAANGDAATARLALATVLGTPADTAFTLPTLLPDASLVRRVAQQPEGTATVDRHDLRAARAGAEAAAADVQRARTLYLPRLNSFARYDWNSSLRPFGGDNNWTVGVMATWTPFAGASEIGERLAAAGRLRAAESARDGADAQAALDMARAESAWRVALARLDIVERMVRQGTDARRIVTRRYEGGLAPVVELLDAQAAETQSLLAYSGARYEVIVATAERARARGLDPSALRSLEDAAPATAER